jgi:hypothetical protein
MLPAKSQTDLRLSYDEQPKSGVWVDVDDVLAHPTQEELDEGQRLGELEDEDEDDDDGA